MYDESWKILDEGGIVSGYSINRYNIFPNKIYDISPLLNKTDNIHYKNLFNILLNIFIGI